jgi:group II intron reverse transcriptase/maturase
MLRIIRRYLEAGVMCNGVVMERTQGTPQGGPLSPLLANVLLDEVDKELEKRGHVFCRYADDADVYLGSKRAADRAMELMRKLYAKLRLKINEDKSAVADVCDRKFLGYSFWTARGGEIRRKVAPKALKAMKARVRFITRRSRGQDMASIYRELGTYLRGWREYFQLAQTATMFGQIDEWIRRRLRAVQFKQWRRSRTAYRKLCAMGVPKYVARAGAVGVKHWWKAARHGALHTAMPINFFDLKGVPRLAI